MTDERRPPSRGARFVIFALVLGMLTAFGPICTDIYLPALPELSDFFACSTPVLQLSLTSSFLGLALGQLVFGPISDAVGRRRPLLLSLLLFSVMSWLCAQATSIEALIVWRFGQGLAGAGGIVLSRAIACDLFKGSALTRFMAILMTVNSAGPILGPLTGSFIITYLPWQAIFILLTVWGALLLGLSAGTLGETRPQSTAVHNPWAAVRGMLSELTNVRFMLLVLAMSLTGAGFFAYLAASPFIFQRIYGFSELGFALVFGFYAIGISLCGLFSGRLSHKVGDRRLVYLSLTVMLTAAAGFAVVAFTEPSSPLPALITLGIFVPCLGSTNTPGFTLTMESARGGSGGASGIFGVMPFICGALATPLVGVMGEQSMSPLAIIMVTSVSLAIVCVYTGLHQPSADR